MSIQIAIIQGYEPASGDGSVPAAVEYRLLLLAQMAPRSRNFW
jgi:hypothetical protein